MSEQQNPASSAQTPTGGILEEERRRNPRTPARAVVMLTWKDSQGKVTDSIGVIRNVSAGGFGVRTDRAFDVGQEITVRTPERSLECEVRHAQTHPNSFMVGLEIKSSSDGSSRSNSLEGLSAALASDVVRDGQ